MKKVQFKFSDEFTLVKLQLICLNYFIYIKKQTMKPTVHFS